MESEKSESRVPLLDGTNYPSWKLRVLVLLDEHELMDCIERELEDDINLVVVRSDDDTRREAKFKAQEKRKRREKRCKSMLIGRIHDSQLEYVQDCHTPKAIWDKLQRVFERKSAASRMSLKMQLLDLRYKGGCLRDHFLAFDRIVRALKGTGSKMDDLDIVCHLLLTMRSSSYATVVTTLETMAEDQLSVDFVQCRLLDEEIKRGGKVVELATPKREPAAFVGKPSVKKWKCFACGQVGHKAAECPEKQSTKKEAAKKEKKKGNANLTEERKEEKKSVCFVAGQCRENNKVLWFADSGASEHMTNDRNLFESLEKLDEPIEIAVALSGKTATAKYSGTIKMIAVADGEECECVLKNVLYAPSLRCNLFSIRKAEMAGMEVVFRKGVVQVLMGSEVVAWGKRNGCQYEMEFYPLSEQSSSMYSCGKIKKDFELWHRRYGHLGAKNLEKIVNQEMVEGIGKCDGSDETIYCEPCIEAKQTRKPFEDGPGRRSIRVLEIVHTDVCGPITPAGHDGSRYYVSFIDDWSRFVMVFTMLSKDQVFEYFQLYEAMVTAKFGVKISYLRCDNGGEYRNKPFEEFCRQRGIQMQFTVPYTPEQNGVSERFNRTGVEKARSMLFDAQVDSKFWCEAIETAAYLSNRSPASVIEEGKTPFELWEGRKPDVSALKVWGSPAYCYVPKENRKKLDRKTWKGIFLGYHCNGYRVWDPESEKVVAIRDVIVDESAKVAAIQKSTSDAPEDGVIVLTRDESDDEGDDTQVELDSSVREPGEESAGEAAPPADVPAGPTERTPGRPVRTKTAPQWHQEYEMNYAAYALNATSFVDNFPDTLDALKKRDDWKHWQVAVNEEMQSHQKNKTWTVAKLPEGRKPITCKWIFKIKRSGSGDPDRYKARLVARGFSQRYGFDYLETYSPVAKMDTVRMLLAVANQQRFEVHQMDVKTAFLNGTLQEEIYMVPPEGLQVKPGLVCRLNRALYGLKQASRTWNDRFHKFVVELGFVRSENDPCLYVRGEKGNQLFLLLYVDDILIGSRHKPAILQVKTKLAKEFEMSDLGEVSSFLGMTIQRDVKERTMRISQKHYLEGLLRRFAMEDCKPAATPLECHLQLKKAEEAERTSKPYRELVGCLNYVSQTTRPDLCAAVNLFSQYQNCPTDQHWSYLKRVLRYVKGTLDVRLEFNGGENEKELIAYCDADWGNDVNDRRSISGYVFRVFGGTVAWQTRKQQSVALSSTEAEFVALCNAACEGVWLRRLLEDVGVVVGGAVTFFEDNQACIKVAEEPRDSRRMKHVDIKFNFIRELILEQKISVKYIPTDQQLADIMTKGLPVVPFARLRDELGLKSSRN